MSHDPLDPLYDPAAQVPDPDNLEDTIQHDFFFNNLISNKVDGFQVMMTPTHTKISDTQLVKNDRIYICMIHSKASVIRYMIAIIKRDDVDEFKCLLNCIRNKLTRIFSKQRLIQVYSAIKEYTASPMWYVVFLMMYTPRIFRRTIQKLVKTHESKDAINEFNSYVGWFIDKHYWNTVQRLQWEDPRLVSRDNEERLDRLVKQELDGFHLYEYLITIKTKQNKSNQN
jgi:hypothetical protein